MGQLAPLWKNFLRTDSWHKCVDKVTVNGITRGDGHVIFSWQTNSLDFLGENDGHFVRNGSSESDDSYLQRWLFPAPTMWLHIKLLLVLGLLANRTEGNTHHRQRRALAYTTNSCTGVMSHLIYPVDLSIYLLITLGLSSRYWLQWRFL